jgi:hypothetical protein
VREDGAARAQGGFPLWRKINTLLEDRQSSTDKAQEFVAEVASVTGKCVSELAKIRESRYLRLCRQRRLSAMELMQEFAASLAEKRIFSLTS